MPKKLLLTAIALLFLLMALGCPGNSRRDVEYRDELWNWILTQDTNGWEVTGWPEIHPVGVVVDHNFRPARLEIAIKGDDVNPYVQRNMIEDIARHWRDEYPINLQPRFELLVYMYNMEISHDKELGFTAIDKDGNVDTHHPKTQDVM